MKYALQFALLGKAEGIKWNEKIREEFKIEDLEDRIGLLLQFEPQDELYLQMGGLADQVAFGAYKKGVKVYRISPQILQTFKKKKANLWESLQDLAERRKDLFQPVFPSQAEILEISALTREWLNQERERKKHNNRLYNKFYRQVLRKPEKWLWVNKKELKEKAREFVKEDPHYQWLLKEEQKTKKELGDAVKSFSLYQEVFSKIDGCGVLITARIITATLDITRFSTASKYYIFAGVGLKNGKKQRKKAGESSGRNSLLNSALHLLTQQLLTYRKDSSLGQILRQRIELEKAREDRVLGKPWGRARWWMGNYLARRIWKEWQMHNTKRAAG